MAAEFTLDTSGAVGPVFDRRTNLLHLHRVRWSDLTPFQQGYVEAAKREFPTVFTIVGGGVWLF
jgi:hypothetical protein